MYIRHMKPVLLRGWKEIAEYLGVARSTAQVWAKQGLPLYSRGAGRGAAIWAKTVELDEWDRRRQRETGRHAA